VKFPGAFPAGHARVERKRPDHALVVVELEQLLDRIAVALLAGTSLNRVT